ncbi:NADH:flavin oxidoreductase/NADH oxidase [Bradyrhizobium pachyrhizi]|uniref:NADH:flavin oxidoreductase/NADH oxidase n=1 Tax=Bradyrhizobium pachyrhizi TaxID=280333 RepID=A0A844T5R3_9BRAD|nr:NADH:flavin oxidoreductase/NADH oxidase [Bradyrhizobium pachyrhizi]MVT70862.1 NADH:flavin oxidoreductase/NADH oxidase [Bradyrhizobium pachyrhizi]WFU55743.1 NADH:flavin oxidoreductase/NADH oxidase [Bradyrhizobium pachyrhizi]
MTELPLLFTPLQLRDLELKNRIMVSPMATYSAQEGRATDWHTAHIGKLAAGGAGLVFVEQSSVNTQGRITHGCLGIWDDAHIADHAALAALIHSFNAKAAIQIAHGGRKGSSQRPWEGGNPLSESDIKARGEGPWQIAASSGIPFDDGWPAPQMLTSEQIDALVDDYRQAFRRARAAGYDVIELHCAHGYLMHSFLSPLANNRNDEYGGSRENRMRLPLRIAAIMREEWPSHLPAFVRISSVDGIDIGWSIEDSIAFAAELKAIGIDMVDCSSGGMKLPRGNSLVSRTPGFQVPFAERIQKEAGMPTVAVGLIREPDYAEAILRDGKATLIALGRELLWNPNWPAQTALALGCDPEWTSWPEQYGWWLKRRVAQQGR